MNLGFSVSRVLVINIEFQQLFTDVIHFCQQMCTVASKIYFEQSLKEPV